MKVLLKIFKFIFIIVLAAVILLNIISIFKRVILKEPIPLVFGYGNAIIITGSMEPAIMPGDMIILHKQSDYKTGDVVTYQGNNTPITHRIVGIVPGGYITQGDANNMDDGEIDPIRIIGKVVKTIPNIGGAILFFQSPFGMLVLIVGLFAMVEIPRLIEKIQNYHHAKNI